VQTAAYGVERGQLAQAHGQDESQWGVLYLTGAGAATPRYCNVLHAGVFLVAGLPTSVTEWYGLFARNGVLGLLAFELLLVLYAVLSIPVVLALFVALRRTNPSLMAIYLAVSLVGIVALTTARPAFEMLSLSNGFAASTTDVERAAYLAAGQAMLAVFQGTGFYVSYILGSVSGLMLALVMVRGTVFSRTTAYLRVGSSILDFGLFLPGIGLLLSLGSVVCLLLFNALVARRLFQLARDTRGA
jgi:hypothetical protein